MKEDTIHVGIVIILFLILGVFLISRAKETVAIDLRIDMIKSEELDEKRQILEVNCDSLLLLLSKLKSINSSVFEYEDRGDKLTIRCRPQQSIAFNRIFLNDTDLSVFAGVKNNTLAIDTEKKHFTATARHYEGMRYVKLPADLLQSMLLSLEN